MTKHFVGWTWPTRCWP